MSRQVEIFSSSQRNADICCLKSASFRARQRSPTRFTNASARHRAQIDRMSRLGRRFLHDRDIFVPGLLSME